MGGQADTIETEPTAGEDAPARRRLDLDRTYILVALLAVALVGLARQVEPADFWWHLASGRHIVETGSIPTTDIFSWTQAGEPFFTQPWLAQVLMYLFHSLGGLPLLLVIHAVLLTGGYALLLRECVAITGRERLSALTLLLFTLPPSVINWSVRPQSWAIPLFLASLVLLSAYRRGGATRAIWLLPLLMALWVNLHGAFVTGLALVGVTVVVEGWRTWRGHAGGLTPERWWRLMAVAATTGAAVFANPRGVGVIAYVVELLTSSTVAPLVTEWSVPEATSLYGALFFGASLVLIAALTLTPRPPSATDLLIAAAFWVLALTAIRHALWFAAAGAPVLARAIVARTPAPEPRAGAPAVSVGLLGIVMLGLVMASPWVRPLVFDGQRGELVGSLTPVAAVAALQGEAQAQLRLFNYEAAGSYLIWQTPEQPVFIDPRFEFYPPQQWDDYRDLSAGRRVEELIAQYEFEGFIVDVERQAPLVTALEELEGWAVAHRDERAALFLPR